LWWLASFLGFKAKGRARGHDSSVPPPLSPISALSHCPSDPQKRISKFLYFRILVVVKKRRYIQIKKKLRRVPRVVSASTTSSPAPSIPSISIQQPTAISSSISTDGLDRELDVQPIMNTVPPTSPALDKRRRLEVVTPVTRGVVTVTTATTTTEHISVTPFQIFLRVTGKSSISLYVKSSDTVQDLKAMLSEHSYFCRSVSSELQGRHPSFRLLYAGKQLQDGRSLCDYNIQKHSTVEVTASLRGGRPMEEEGPPEDTFSDCSIELRSEHEGTGNGMRGGASSRASGKQKYSPATPPPLPSAEDSVQHTFEVLLDVIGCRARELSEGLYPVKVSEMTGENPSPKDLQDSQFAAAHVALMNAKTLSILTQVATQAKKGIAVAPWPGGGNGGGGGPWRGCSRER
jgi:hypothetical protein